MDSSQQAALRHRPHKRSTAIPPMPLLPTAPVAASESRKLDKDEMAGVAALTELFAMAKDDNTGGAVGQLFPSCDV